MSLFLFFSVGVTADFLDENSAEFNASVSSSSGSLGFDVQADTVFLPVHEAYRPEVTLANNEIYIDWQIAAGYYLYGEQFREDLVQQNEVGNSLLEIESRRSVGEISYDDYYEKDVEKFYRHASIKLALKTMGDNEVPQQNLLQGRYVLTLAYQGCADAGLCYPPESLHFQIVDGDIQALEIDAVSTSDTDAGKMNLVTNSDGVEDGLFGFFWMLLFALLGGLLLNLMPCVFPVLSIKVLSFMSSSGSVQHLRWHSWCYAAGIVASFVSLALVLMLLRQGGEQIGWGFQLQSPLFVGVLIYLFFVLGLSLSGLLTLGTRWMGLGQHLTEKKGLQGAFYTGVLAVLVSSPCSVPFMGVALGYALTQSVMPAIMIFVALGLGLALPFVVLAHVPAMLAYLPKPGPWMERFKQLLAFPLYLTVVWLLWVLGHQVGSDAIALLLTGLVLVVFAIWVLNINNRASIRTIIAISIFGAGLLVPLLWLLSKQQYQELNQTGEAVSPVVENAHWQPYQAERLSTLLQQGEPVFIELTADWCITCLMNEKVALQSSAVENYMVGNGIHYLRGDWTNGNSEVTALLQRYQRGGVPLYLFFPAGQREAVVLPQVLTPGLVLDALQGRLAD